MYNGHVKEGRDTTHKIFLRIRWFYQTPHISELSYSSTYWAAGSEE